MLILAPFIALLLIQVVVSSMAGRTVSWGEMMDAVAETGLMAIVCGGVFIDVVLGLVAFGLGYRLRNGNNADLTKPAALAAIIVGAVGAFLSMAILGGIIGAIGGLLVAVGGAFGLL